MAVPKTQKQGVRIAVCRPLRHQRTTHATPSLHVIKILKGVYRLHLEQSELVFVCGMVWNTEAHQLCLFPSKDYKESS